MTIYTDAQRALQDQYDTRQLADAIEAAVVREALQEDQRAFIESREFFFLSSVNSQGEPTVSYKGGGAGVVSVVNERTLAFPIYDGNGMFLSVGNISDTGKIGLLFIDLETPHRIRVQARATTHAADPLMDAYPGAIAIVRADVDQVFVNCARYIHKHKKLETSRHVPDADGHQPHATWKRIDDLQDHLPAKDKARTDREGGVITASDYAQALSKGNT